MRKQDFIWSLLWGLLYGVLLALPFLLSSAGGLQCA